ncbi:MAG: CHRD domain-containing protein [Ilumatobacteraceae bacterium]
MQRTKMFAIGAIGLAAAIAVPTIAFGNARNNNADFAATGRTPFVTRMLGANEVPTTGDPDGFGGAAVTFDLTTPGVEDVCWDFSYGNLTGTPTAAHIHPGAAGVANPPAIALGNLGATSATGCRALTVPEAVVANDIVLNPANYYVNVHTSDFPGGAIRGQLAAGPAPAGDTHLLPVPLRAYDSRDNAGAKINPLETRTISLAAGKDGAGVIALAVPPGATGAIVTLTITETGTGIGGAGGFLTMWSADVATQPSTSSINWSGPNENVAVTAQVAVSAAGSVKVAAGANQTHFVIDVIGYTF